MNTQANHIGTIVSFDNPQLSSQLFNYGFDFIMIDLEHGNVSDHSIQTILLSRKPQNKVLIRLSEISEKAIKHALDIGSDGIIAPRLESLEELNTLIRYAYFPPQGERSVGLCWANSYGEKLQAYSNHFKPFLLPQIESRKGVGIIEEVLANEFISGIFIGPYDLSFSLGVPGNFEHPEFKTVFDAALEACEKHDKIFCTYAHQIESALQLTLKGIPMIVVGTDNSIFQSAYHNIINQLKSI